MFCMIDCSKGSSRNYETGKTGGGKKFALREVREVRVLRYAWGGGVSGQRYALVLVRASSLPVVSQSQRFSAARICRSLYAMMP